MPSGRGGVGVCPGCGYEVKEPERTWQLVSPLPDSKGRITITIMGSYRCPNCGRKWRGVVSKIKTGGGEVEIEGGGRSSRKISEKSDEDRGTVIEIDLSELEEDLD